MPPGRNSRYRFCQALKGADGNRFLTDREPFGYRELSDNRRHNVEEGDTLFSLAGKFFDAAGIDEPSEFWWVIADFQPQPIFDPTVRLELGRTMHIPSVRSVLEQILSEKRRAEHL